MEVVKMSCVQAKSCCHKTYHQHMQTYDKPIVIICRWLYCETNWTSSWYECLPIFLSRYVWNRCSIGIIVECETKHNVLWNHNSSKASFRHLKKWVTLLYIRPFEVLLGRKNMSTFYVCCHYGRCLEGQI